MPPVNEHNHLYAPRASVVHKRIQRGAGRSPRKQHIVHQYDIPVCDLAHHVRRVCDLFARVPVIPVCGRIQIAYLERTPLERSHLTGNRCRHGTAAPPDTDQFDVGRSAVAFDNLTGKPHQHTLHALR